MRKIRFALLVADNMKPIPQDVEVQENWGLTAIRTDDGKTVYGEHMCLSATEDSIKTWLRPFDGVWIGQGPPSAEQFYIGHIG